MAVAAAEDSVRAPEGFSDAPRVTHTSLSSLYMLSIVDGREMAK